MIEPRWEVKIGSPVVATDGEYGHLEKLLMDPSQERVVALLVRPHILIPSPMVVVPEELIADASENGVRLEISREDVAALPKFTPESMGEQFALRARAGKQVFCRDGFAGRVSQFLLDPMGRVKGLVLHTGHLPLIGRDQIVPAAWVQEVKREHLHLSVYKSELKNLPDYASDAALLEKVDSALWSDDILRNTDYVDIDASVQDGTVILRGHVISLLNKTRVENAARSVAGVLGVENELVVDQDLAIAVAQTLGNDELTRFERILVGVDSGVITLNGRVRSMATCEAAEAIAASISHVRGVINCLEVPNLVINPERQQFWQPPIGREVFAADMRLGQIERVVINPRNRRVTAFVVHGHFPDPRNRYDDRLSGEDLQQERRVVIPIFAVRYATDSSVMLMESSFEAALHPEFDPVDFIRPPAAWQPPYPYCLEEVLFEQE